MGADAGVAPGRRERDAATTTSFASRPATDPDHDARLLAAAERAALSVNSLSVQSTTLDDVFVHYTGRELRDELQSASPQDSPFMIRRG